MLAKLAIEVRAQLKNLEQNLFLSKKTKLYNIFFQATLMNNAGCSIVRIVLHF